MNPPRPNYSKYVTPKSSPSCVRYWDRELYNTSLWLDWTILKVLVESLIPEVMETLSVTRKKATNTVWTAFIEATCGDKESPCHPLYKDFVKTLDAYTFAYWTPRLTVGSDIHDGYSEEQAMERFRNWLKDDPKNPIYGPFRVSPNLKIIKDKNTHRRFKK